MLVLYRDVGETIIIGDDVEITIMGLQGDGKDIVRFGITAPDDVSIHREEIYKRILEEE